MSVKRFKTSLGALSDSGTDLEQGPRHCLQVRVDNLGLQVEQITLPQDVTTRLAEVMVIHMLQWSQGCMLSELYGKSAI